MEKALPLAVFVGDFGVGLFYFFKENSNVFNLFYPTPSLTLLWGH